MDDTVRTDPRALVCPRCLASWPEKEAPPVCTKDGSSLVRAKEMAAATKDPMVGRTLEGRYTITARLGSGSMGTVYRATQKAMGRDVAIKILRGDRASDDTAKARFMREARANSLLASPNTVTVFDFGQSESGEFYLAMELLEGESLGQRLTRLGRLPIPVAIDAARQALRSLAEAHAKGIIHRDLKPDNLFFARVLRSVSASSPTEGHEEILKILDFGIAKMVGESDGRMGVVETQAGTVFGTPRYMSPEQAQGKPLDARTDLYSLGVMLYQMIAGRPPFTDNDAVVVMARHIKSIPKRITEVAPEVGISKELEDVVMRLLAKDPTDRQASAEALSGELLAALEAHGPNASGVRSSIANAAGIPTPDSRHPPPLLASPPRRDGLPPAVLAAIVAMVVVVAAAAVYLGMRSGKASAAAADSAASSAPAAGGSASASTAEGASSPSPSGALAAPPVTADMPATASAEPPPRPAEHVDHTPSRPHGRPTARPGRAAAPAPPTPRTAAPPAPPAPAPSPPTPTPAPPPSATSNYNVFDN
jgi:serine/threonine-protein kinase